MRNDLNSNNYSNSNVFEDFREDCLCKKISLRHIETMCSCPFTRHGIIFAAGSLLLLGENI